MARVSNKIRQQYKMEVEYTGFVPPAGWSPTRVSIDKLDPKAFFNKYVATRTPVVITGHIKDPEWKGTV